jgi:hypothetical protein
VKRHYARSRERRVTEWVGSLPWLRVLSVWTGRGYLGVFIAGCMWCSTVEFTVGENSDE